MKSERLPTGAASRPAATGLSRSPGSRRPADGLLRNLLRDAALQELSAGALARASSLTAINASSPFSSAAPLSRTETGQSESGGTTSTVPEPSAGGSSRMSSAPRPAGTSTTRSGAVPPLRTEKLPSHSATPASATCGGSQRNSGSFGPMQPRPGATQNAYGARAENRGKARHTLRVTVDGTTPSLDMRGLPPWSGVAKLEAGDLMSLRLRAFAPFLAGVAQV